MEGMFGSKSSVSITWSVNILPRIVNNVPVIKGLDTKHRLPGRLQKIVQLGTGTQTMIVTPAGRKQI